MLEVAGTVSLVEVIFALIEIIGVCYVWRLYRSADKRVRVAERYHKLINVDDLVHQYEAAGMLELARDRRQRKLSLLVVLGLGLFLSVGAMTIPNPVRAEVQLFNAVGSFVLVARDVILVVMSRNTLISDRKVDEILAEKRKIARIVKGEKGAS